MRQIDRIMIVLFVIFAILIAAPASAVERHMEPWEYERTGDWSFPYLSYEYLPSGEVLVSTTFQGGYPLEEVTGSLVFDDDSYATFDYDYEVETKMHTLHFTPSRERGAGRFDQRVELGVIHDPGPVTIEVGYFSPVMYGEQSYALTSYEVDLATFDFDHQLCLRSWREVFVEFYIHSLRTVPETADLDIWDKTGRLTLISNAPVNAYGHLGVLKWSISRHDLLRFVRRGSTRMNVTISLDGESVTRTVVVDWRNPSRCDKG